VVAGRPRAATLALLPGVRVGVGEGDVVVGKENARRERYRAMESKILSVL